MKRVVFFVLIAGAGVAALVWMAGGLDGPGSERPRPVVEHVAKAEADAGHALDPGGGLPKVERVLQITQMAPPRAIVWKDKLSDETIEIPGFVPWRFSAGKATGIRPADSDQQGVFCENVIITMYRDPASHAEALALARSEDGAYEALRHQEIEAAEATVHGRLAEKLQRSGSTPAAARDEDTMIQLAGGVRLKDLTQGMEMEGEAMTVWPDQERGVSRSPFVVRHEALVLNGDGLTMERVKEKGWSRLEILRNPVLRIISDVKRKDGKPVFDFGPGDFRPANISSRGRAILIREERRRDTEMTVTFTKDVLAEQKGGRSLRAAGQIVLTASRPLLGRRDASGKGPGWRLQQFLAEDDVHVEYPSETADGKAYIASIGADRMTHVVPPEGEPQTVFEGDPTIVMRGEVPLLGPGGRLLASCRDRAWIGPAPAALPTSGVPREQLQHIALRGQARVERHGLDRAKSQDVLEGDEIDLLVMPDGKRPAGDEARGSSMIATYFASLGNVRLGGTRIVGSTHRLVGEDLHTEHPHVFAEGEGSRFTFPNLGADQRLLGPEPAESGSAAPAPARGGAATASAGSAGEGSAKGRWLLNRMRALGSVDIDTSMGGPAVGIPAHVTGREVTYDRISSLAQVLGPASAPAHIAWGATSEQMNVVETPSLTLDRARGVVTAAGGVHSEIHVSRGGGASVLRPPARQADAGEAGHTTLTVQTDDRIDIDLVSMRERLRPKAGAEQRIRIGGPVVAELRGPDQATDRMRADSLEIGLLYSEPARAAPAASSSPASRAGPVAAPSAPRGDRGTKKGSAPAPTEPIVIDAREMRAHLVAGTVRGVEATGAVDMRAKDAHITGERLTYDAQTHRAQVFASKPDWSRRPASALLGDTAQRTEVLANELEVIWEAGAAKRVQAHAPAGGSAEIQLFRHDKKRPGQAERYTLTYWGTVEMTGSLLQAGRVVVVRRMRSRGQSAWGPPAVLWSKTLRVLGTNMLSSDERVRDVRRIIAEGRKTAFKSGEGARLLEVWGHRLDFDVASQKARLTGLPGEDVIIREGGTYSESLEIVIDLRTNLPTYIRGSRVRRGGRNLPPPRAPAPKADDPNKPK